MPTERRRARARKVGGLIARFKGKPELSAEQFEGMEAFDAVTGDHEHEHGHDHEHGGDTKEQIAAYRETLTESEQADLLVDFNLEPKKALKRVIKDGKKEGYVFDRDELAEELDEMNKGGAFDDIKLDAVARQSLFSRGGEQEQRSRAPDS